MPVCVRKPKMHVKHNVPRRKTGFTIILANEVVFGPCQVSYNSKWL